VQLESSEADQDHRGRDQRNQDGRGAESVHRGLDEHERQGADPDEEQHLASCADRTGRRSTPTSS
jgi:hypothetical protein